MGKHRGGTESGERFQVLSVPEISHLSMPTLFGLSVEILASNRTLHLGFGQ
jgi:hypothetical protein